MTDRNRFARAAAMRAAGLRAEAAAKRAEALGTAGARRFAARLRAEAGGALDVPATARLGRHGRRCDDGGVCRVCDAPGAGPIRAERA